MSTDTILNKISHPKAKQKDVAELCAKAILENMNGVDWKAINSGIVRRWSKSARERVLTMAWKIVEDAHRFQMRGDGLT